MPDYLEQYGDLFLKAQATGQYKMFLFDVKDSKKFSYVQGINFYQSLINFVNSVTNDLLGLEKKLNRKILHRHLESFDGYNIDDDKDKVILQISQHSNKTKLYRFDCQNPLFWLGDLMHFIILRDSISDEEFFAILQKNKDKIIPNFDLHYSIGYYETDSWAESDKKFSRIYCIPILEELAKKSKKLITTKNVEMEKE